MTEFVNFYLLFLEVGCGVRWCDGRKVVDGERSRWFGNIWAKKYEQFSFRNSIKICKSISLSIFIVFGMTTQRKATQLKGNKGESIVN